MDEAPSMKQKCGSKPLDLSTALERLRHVELQCTMESCIRIDDESTYKLARMSKAKTSLEHSVLCLYCLGYA
ncbi:hypothetical protein L915_02199 [Phytophthora nicotianae]|uniref:Uncharacterized protein n=1 Tax=Phytophthora nicotianae TaxID=4792 RepID=W2HJP9_PHYNI|nr:hypothetical protein L915_02199 [Phytophthora nicotianae]